MLPYPFFKIQQTSENLTGVFQKFLESILLHRCNSPAFRMLLLFLRDKSELITAMPYIMALRAQAHQVIVIQCQLWVLFQLFNMMDLLCLSDLRFRCRKSHTVLIRFLKSGDTVLTFTSISCQYLDTFQFPSFGVVEMLYFFIVHLLTGIFHLVVCCSSVRYSHYVIQPCHIPL